MNTLEEMDLGDIEHIVPFIKAINLLKEHILVSEMEDFVDESDPWFPLYESLQDLKEHELELYPDFDEEKLLAEYDEKTTKEQGTHDDITITDDEGNKLNNFRDLVDYLDSFDSFPWLPDALSHRFEQKTTKEQGTQTTLNIVKNELIEWCCECCSTMAFKINEWQDPFYDENGIRRRECLGCGRYAEETISTDPKKTDEDDDDDESDDDDIYTHKDSFGLFSFSIE